MLKPKKEMISKVTEMCPAFPIYLSWEEMEDILFECNEWDMEFYIEELISSAGRWDWSLNISYYDDNAWCICLIQDVDYNMQFNSAEDVVATILYWQERVNYFKEKFLKLKEE